MVMIAFEIFTTLAALNIIEFGNAKENVECDFEFDNKRGERLTSRHEAIGVQLVLLFQIVEYDTMTGHGIHCRYRVSIYNHISYNHFCFMSYTYNTWCFEFCRICLYTRNCLYNIQIITKNINIYDTTTTLTIIMNGNNMIAVVLMIVIMIVTRLDASSKNWIIIQVIYCVY